MEKEVKKVIIEELFSSEYMKEYIENNFDSFDAITLGSLIYNAPIELKRKKEISRDFFKFFSAWIRGRIFAPEIPGGADRWQSTADKAL